MALRNHIAEGVMALAHCAASPFVRAYDDPDCAEAVPQPAMTMYSGRNDNAAALPLAQRALLRSGGGY